MVEGRGITLGRGGRLLCGGVARGLGEADVQFKTFKVQKQGLAGLAATDHSAGTRQQPGYVYV